MGTAQILVLTNPVSPWEKARLRWQSSAAGVLLPVSAFGGPTLAEVRVANEPTTLRHQPALARGRWVDILLANPFGSQLHAVAALVIDALG